LAKVAYDFMQSRPGTLLWLLYWVAAAIPLTFLHELGHALVAQRRLGGEVAISVGTAGKVAELRLAQIKVSVNALFDPTRPPAPRRSTRSGRPPATSWRSHSRVRSSRWSRRRSPVGCSVGRREERCTPCFGR